MMQGMAPPGPPGTYMPGPYMQPMPYPPGMPPPNGVFCCLLMGVFVVFMTIESSDVLPCYGADATYVQPSHLSFFVCIHSHCSAPQAYMPPPPPGAYAPPPPNGAGPRPSMPPTPIPAPTHPYYHQSPQSMLYIYICTVKI